MTWEIIASTLALASYSVAWLTMFAVARCLWRVIATIVRELATAAHRKPRP